MRILHVTDHFPPVLGGIEAHVSSLAARQTAAGHDVTVLTCQAAGEPDAVAYDVVRARSRLEVALTASDYDVVHAHLSVVAPFTAPVTARLARAGVPTVATVHSLWSSAGPVPRWAVRVSGLTPATVRWTSVSRTAAATVAAQLGCEVDVLPNAVDVAPRAATPRSGPVRLVSTMRLARRKRPMPLLRLLDPVLRREEPRVELVLVGDGPQMGRLAGEVRVRGLGDRVRFTGRVAPAEVARIVAGADVYVAPARLESFGLAALEAREVGLPVVGFARSGIGELVEHGREGLLADDDAGLRRQVERLVDDAGLRLRIAEHNRTVRSSFTWGRTLAAHDAAYADLVGSRELV